MGEMIAITAEIAIDPAELQWHFVQASGPGGQNVNKVATAVQLGFDVFSPSLPEPVRERLIRLAGKRINRDGLLIITAQAQRTQERNRQDALDRLVALIRAAAVPPKQRRPTRPSAAARRKRLEAKQRRSELKRMRRRPPADA